MKHVIDTGDHPPIKQHLYQVPIVYCEKIAQMISSMQEQGVIRPLVSPWVNPVVCA